MRHRTWRGRQSARHALTVVELLVATTLASMLVVAVLGILGILAQKRKVLLDEATFSPWQQRLTDQLRWDLRNARRLDLAPDRLRLVGYGGRDFETARPTHRWAEFVYRLEKAAGEVWLLREESHLDSLSSANRRTEIVCFGVTEIAIDVPGEPQRKRQRSGSVPESFRLVMVGNSPSENILEMLYTH